MCRRGGRRGFTEQGVGQLRGQLEEDDFDEEMIVGEGEDAGNGASGAVGAVGTVGAVGAEEQDMGIEEAKHQPEHIEEEKDIVDNPSTLPFRSL